jgi:hypothetical protein
MLRIDARTSLETPRVDNFPEYLTPYHPSYLLLVAIGRFGTIRTFFINDLIKLRRMTCRI